MKVWQVFNRYRDTVNGEEFAVRNTHELLLSRGVRSRLVLEDSGTVSGTRRRLAAAAGSIHNPAAYRRMRREIRADRPDVAHAHNLLPLFSPSVLQAFRDESVPLVLTAHSFFLTCPVYTHFRDGEICHRCQDVGERACFTNDCRGNRAESAAYALRTWVARRTRVYIRNADIVIALSRFARQWLIEYGFAAERVAVVPNFAHAGEAPSATGSGRYAAFAGRINAAKGIDVLLAAARQASLPVRIAGAGASASSVAATANVEFVGVLDRDRMRDFYRDARFLVVPSGWYEMCPLVILEAMAFGLPVIASDIGGLPELVEHGVTGLLFEPGNAGQLADRMQRLWSDDGLRAKLGAEARHRAETRYSADTHFRELYGLYRKVTRGGAV